MKQFWREHLEQEPALQPHLERLARKFIRTGSAPKSFTFTLGSDQPAIRRALEFIFAGGRWTDGKLIVKLPQRLCTHHALQALADHLAIAPEVESATDGNAARTTALLRQKLLHPSCAGLLDALAQSDDLVRFFRHQTQAETTLDGLLRAVEQLQDNHAAITLSQLGADALHDSKALRSGVRRKLLVTLLATLAEAEDDEAAQVLARFGVIDNPYTTQVLLYGPLAYTDEGGRVWDWPAQLHGIGLAVALTWEQVQGMRSIQPLAPVDGVITSENAASFHRLVDAHSPAICIYTAGYPNSAVMRVLALLAQAGLQARHWGDSDLDGLRIAECVSRVIPMQLYVQDAATCTDRLIPLTAVQQQRARTFLTAHPEFPLRDQLIFTLQHGWLEQEQSVSEF